MITTFASSREKLIGLDIDDIPDKMFANEVYKSLNGEFGYYEGEYISYTGRKKSIIKANWIPIFRDGNVIAGVGIVEDITKRKRAEEALRKNEEKLARAKKMESLGLLNSGKRSSYHYRTSELK
jgi:PAS domain-containing protein